MIKRRISILSILAIFILVLSTTVLADTSVSKTKKIIDGINVELILDNNGIKTGINKLTIKLYDNKKHPLENANIKVTADMPGDNMENMKMAHTTPKSVKFNPTNKNGEYTGNISFSDKGTWRVKTNFTVEDQEKTVYFNIDVNKSDINWYPIIGISAAIILIIVIVIIRKNKKLPSYENDF
ncbi:FixH family protein [Clostridium tyrobutyricum]|uniref:FixH family protein n=1 Tax=Clostridium tyrobutyricum TaxID=1519 RepID=UPI0002D3E852|nr:FixH family protein [Clostridium tyrobutyricum]MBV4417549.1 FixH family protein [Clostridium tyrobutyricum]MBV4423063.1 FixH family protein [Clostridium tyrobutyricum]MBV4425983.1 FixH family protein [Clostridium tyrobutyricum]MEA5009891.1 FixH family protein [Clostridium tyrobutyricum]